MIGTRLAHYQITQHLGTGGMGEVYEAADSKLGRSVAVKFLPNAFSTDPERVGRFQREARVLASLSHPNIAGIHGIEEIDNRIFLVLELVPGETLADRIQRGPIPLDEALPIAAQIAEALEAAHEAGIVHRDLKPANIKLTPDGKVKVLDFGLAKALSADEPEQSATMSPTISLAATQRGQIMGTAGYMSPEQARGKPADRRADIWAFGVVLYEMTTADRLFKGEDMTDTLAAVVREKPDFSRAPIELHRVLQKCLERDPKSRLRHISGYALLLESPRPEKVVATPLPARSRLRWLPWGAAALAAMALAALAIVHFRETPPELRAIQFLMEPPAEGAFQNFYGAFAVSPDGRYVVFSATNKNTPGAAFLYLRPLNSLAARAIPGTENGNFPTWSWDSKSLVFLASGKLKRIEIAGGSPLTLADTNESPVTSTGAWNANGVILFGASQGLYRVSAAGGGATPLTKVDGNRSESGHGYPQFIDNNRFLYFVASSDPNVQGVYASSLDSPEKSQLIVRTGAKGVFVPGHGASPDYLLWMQDQTLLAQRFDVGNMKVEGDPSSITEGVRLNPNLPIRAAYWASESGVLIYLNQIGALKRRIVLTDQTGKEIREAAPEDQYTRVALSPDGEKIAVAKWESGSRLSNLDIWVRELARGVTTRLTFDPGSDDLPVWSPDGKRVAFVGNREGKTDVYIKDASGAGKEERLTNGPYSKQTLDWSKDGRYILYREANPATGRDLMAVPVVAVNGEHKPFPVVQTMFSENTGAISPDGNWTAYSSNESGSNEVYVQAFPGVAGAPAGRWQISVGSGYDVRWRKDGKEIYYQHASDRKVMAVTVQTGPQGVRAEPPRVLFAGDFGTTTLREFDATPDGQRFLYTVDPKDSGNTQRLTVVSNWQAALRK